MKYAEHCEANPEFTAQAAKEAVALGTALVVAAGSWKGAVTEYRKAWTARKGNHLTGCCPQSWMG